ncbi:MAG: hypothetical protein ACYCTH_12895 [Cellulomonas sp.]
MIDALDRIAAAMPLVLTVVAVAAALLAITLVVRVVRKAGYSPWWAIGVFVPGVNLVLLVMFATVRWPLERRLGEAEQRLALAPHRGGTTPDVVAASTPPQAGAGVPRSAGAPTSVGSSVRARPASGPDSGSTPVHGTGAVAPDPRPVLAPPTFAPPTFTPVPYPGDTRPDMGG